MYSMISLVQRNIKTYLRDKTAVFFSFLSVIILLMLYLLFLGNNMRPGGMENILTESQITFLVYAQLIPGLVVINSVSIPLGNLGIMINDFEYRQIDGFLVTPVKRYKIILAYYIASFMITFIISLLMLVAAFLIVGLSTGIYLNMMSFIYSALLIILIAFVSTAIMVLITSLIKSVNAFGAVAGVFGTIIGFGAGIYMPLFILPDFMRKVASLLPFTHMNIALKRIVLPQAFDLLDMSKFESAEQYHATMAEFKVAYGYNELGVLGFDVPLVIVLIGSILLGAICLAIATKLMSRRLSK